MIKNEKCLNQTFSAVWSISETSWELQTTFIWTTHAQIDLYLTGKLIADHIVTQHNLGVWLRNKYFHWAESLIVIEVNFMKKVAMRWRSKGNGVLRILKLGMTLLINVLKDFRFI